MEAAPQRADGWAVTGHAQHTKPGHVMRLVSSLGPERDEIRGLGGYVHPFVSFWDCGASLTPPAAAELVVPVTGGSLRRGPWLTSVVDAQRQAAAWFYFTAEPGQSPGADTLGISQWSQSHTVIFTRWSQ